MEKNGIIILNKEEIIETNKAFEDGKLVNDSLDFLETKIQAKKLKENLERNVVDVASIYWYEIITNHPFVDGNKRTAVEVVLHFLHVNNFKLNCGMNALIYTSLRIANKDISYEKLVEWVLEKIEVR